MSPRLGIFDSGVGGFSVVRELRKQVTTDIFYFGDCARAPYGNRPLEEIVSFVREILRHLQGQGVTHFVSACNSMSVLTTNLILESMGIENEHYTDMLRSFRKHQDIPKGSKVLVLGTKATIESRAYQDYLESFGYVVFEYVPHTLAQAIEEDASQEELFRIVDPLIEYAIAVDARYVLFACTHYPLISEVFEARKSRFGWKGFFIDPAVYVAKEVALWGLQGAGVATYTTSKETPAFKKFKPYTSKVIDK